MSYESIYASSKELDDMAKELMAQAAVLIKQAKIDRWKAAPEWASVIVAPTKHGLESAAKKQTADVFEPNPKALSSIYPADVHDWRWATVGLLGQYRFADQSSVPTAAGYWQVAERRPDAKA